MQIYDNEHGITLNNPYKKTYNKVEKKHTKKKQYDENPKYRYNKQQHTIHKNRVQYNIVSFSS